MPDARLRPTPFDAFQGGAPQPAQPFVAIGDVHGRHDLLAPVLARAAMAGLPVVMLGDYIDHGPDSAAVLRLLHQSCAQMPLTCLRGNHEDLLLRFLHRPRRTGRIWLRYGGAACLASFGLPALRPDFGAPDLLAARAALAQAMGDDLIGWLKSLPYLWRSGNVAAVHAGADPAMPLDGQPAMALAWGHPDFGKIPRSDGQWVLHGHQIVRRWRVADGTIALDTGAWRTGRLTALVIGDGPLRAL